jgi:photosynthetic reaction center cytochrome c subunit
MISQPPNLFPEVLDDPRRRFYLLGGLFLGFMAVVSIATFWWIFYRVVPPPAEPVASAVYVNYDVRGSYIQPESLAAMTAYINANPQPQNVQVLQGLSTAEISNYMVSQVSGGLKVDCSYCHNVANFAEEGNPNKTRARQMMLMSADLNQNWITRLPASVGGYQVTCATCHNGRPQFETYPASIQNTLPNDFRLPLERAYPGVLVVTGDNSKSNPDVELNQYVMYHMNVSLGQGCTFCHNARYFPSYEIEQKAYAYTMLNMAKHIQDTYVAPNGQLVDGIMAGKTPSCYMCHQGARIPGGAAKPGQVPAVLSSSPPE